MANKNKGMFIVFEGIDGSGISTQTQILKSELEKQYGIKAVLAKEPSEGPVGTVIRQVLSSRMTGVDDRCLALLFAADRLDHNNNKIIPVLEKGDFIICDRYLWSTYAYQGMKNDHQWLEVINQNALKPDLTIFIKVRPETSLKRITGSRHKTEIFEETEILQLVLNNYIKLFKQWKDLGEDVIEIDGEQDPAAVQKEILAAIQPYLMRK